MHIQIQITVFMKILGKRNKLNDINREQRDTPETREIRNNLFSLIKSMA